MAFHHKEGSYPLTQSRASTQIQHHPRRPVEAIIQPHVSSRPRPTTQYRPTIPNSTVHNMLFSGILRLRALQSTFNLRAQPRRFSPFCPSLPPLFPFPPPHLPTRLNPPMMYTDYSMHLNLPAPPIDKVFQSACMWPRWWTTSVPPLDESTIHSHPATPTYCLPPPSTLLVKSGTSDLSYGDVLNMYDTTGELQQSLCTSPALISSAQQPLPQPSSLSSLQQPLSPAAIAIQPFNFPPLPFPPDSYPALPFSDKEPPYSFTALAGLAIMSYPQKKATLNEIYSFIASTFPFYKRSQRAWKNSIRNCLYSSDCFIRPHDKGGKNVYWTINSRAKTHILKGSFKAKRPSVATGKTRKKSAKQLEQESRGYFECFNIVPIPNENTKIYDLFPPGAVKDVPTISVIHYDDVTSGIKK